MTVSDTCPPYAPTMASSRTTSAFSACCSSPECDEVLRLGEPDFAFADAVAAASSVRVHVKVPNTQDLLQAALCPQEATPENQILGYVRSPHPGGVNFVFSSINVCEDGLLVGGLIPTAPRMDKLAVDPRFETGSVPAVFDAVPSLAGDRECRYVAQGAVQTPVVCRHTEVEGKHWAYPPIGDIDRTRPIETALGELAARGKKRGCDRRTIEPAHPRAAEVRSACASRTKPSGSPSGAGSACW